MTEALASVGAVAIQLLARKGSICGRIERRGLPATKIGKLWRLKPSAVDAWMRASSRSGAKMADALPYPGRSAERRLPGGMVLVTDDGEPVRHRRP